MLPSLPGSHGPIHTTRLAAATLALGLALGALPPAMAADAAGLSSAVQNAGVIGVIGQQRLHESDVVATDAPDFDRLQEDYDRGLHQLQMKFDQQRHDLLQRQLDKLLDQRALAMEAKARGVNSDTVLADLKVAVVTDDDARAFYAANKDRIPQPYELVATQVREYLSAQRSDEATRRFYAALRTKHGIVALLAPYRVTVAAIGPARGPDSAPVTIVEFGDFQCPYCRQAEDSLRTVMAHYPNQVRVVFRNLPLQQLHPNALIAAKAGVCADRQGKFWPMHDAMYADQSSLGLDALKDTAKRLGLDASAFSTCLADPATSRSIDADAAAALQLGLTGTPYFFINGRPIDGNVPVEKFDSVITDELHRAAEPLSKAADHGTAPLQTADAR